MQIPSNVGRGRVLCDLHRRPLITLSLADIFHDDAQPETRVIIDVLPRRKVRHANDVAREYRKVPT